jgi:hypothetical protein
MTPADLRRGLRAMFGDDVHRKTLTTVQNAVEAVLAKATLALCNRSAADVTCPLAEGQDL